jgi:hypothetical protein
MIFLIGGKALLESVFTNNKKFAGRNTLIPKSNLAQNT